MYLGMYRDEEEFKYVQRLANIESLRETGFTEDEIAEIIDADDPDTVIDQILSNR